jgi:hypothetical protein
MWNLLLNNKVRHLLALCMIWAGLAAQAQPTSWVRTFATTDDDRADNMAHFNGRFYVVGTYGLALAYMELDMQGTILHNKELKEFMPYSYIPTHIIPYNDSVRIWGSGALCDKIMYVTLNLNREPVSNYMYMMPTGYCAHPRTMFVDNKNLVFASTGGIFNTAYIHFQRIDHSSNIEKASKHVSGTTPLYNNGGPIKIFPKDKTGNYLIFTPLDVCEIDSMGNTVRIETLRDRHPRPTWPSDEFKPPAIFDIVQADSAGYYISGDESGHINLHDSTGRIVSSRTIAWADYTSTPQKMCKTKDGGFAFAGNKLTKTDIYLNVQWVHDLENGTGIKAFGQAEDGGFYGCFHNWTNEELSNDIIAFKTEPDGRILTGMQEKLRVQRGYYAYPNPVTDVLHLRNMNDVVHITLTNALGQTVYSGLETAIDMRSLPIGMYYLHVTTTAQQYVEPIIKQ